MSHKRTPFIKAVITWAPAAAVCRLLFSIKVGVTLNGCIVTSQVQSCLCGRGMWRHTCVNTTLSTDTHADVRPRKRLRDAARKVANKISVLAALRRGLCVHVWFWLLSVYTSVTSRHGEPTQLLPARTIRANRADVVDQQWSLKPLKKLEPLTSDNNSRSTACFYEDSGSNKASALSAPPGGFWDLFYEGKIKQSERIRSWIRDQFPL